MKHLFKPVLILALLASCGRTGHIGKPPDFSETDNDPEQVAMLWPGLPIEVQAEPPIAGASLWRSGQRSLLGDRRAEKRGDILTVVIDIDEEASISNKTHRKRSGSESLELGQLFGLPQRTKLPGDATLGDAVEIDSNSDSAGSGSVKSKEELTLRLAATVVDVLPNGVLSIVGKQELRVNFELRELTVTGYVRPEDISRQNEITYDKIASARVSYGGRGQITDVQQPRYGQQILDVFLPF